MANIVNVVLDARGEAVVQQLGKTVDTLVKNKNPQHDNILLFALLVESGWTPPPCAVGWRADDAKQAG